MVSFMESSFGIWTMLSPEIMGYPENGENFGLVNDYVNDYDNHQIVTIIFVQFCRYFFLQYSYWFGDCCPQKQRSSQYLLRPPVQSLQKEGERDSLLEGQVC